MDLKLFKSDASSTQPPAAPVKTANNYGYPTEGGSGVNATVLGPHWFFQLLQEFENVISGSYSPQTNALTPDATSLTQLRDSINRLITQGIANGAIGNSNIADNSVTSQKIANNAVTADKIANNSIDKSKLNLNFHEFSYSALFGDVVEIEFVYRNGGDTNYTNRFFSAPIISFATSNNFPAINQNFLISTTGSGYNVKGSSYLSYYYKLDVQPGTAWYVFKQYCIDIVP